MKLTTFIFTLLVTATVAAQNRKLDSLYQVLQTHTAEDTNRVNTLTRACYYEYTSTPEKSRKHAEEAKRIAEKIGYQKGVGLALRYMSLNCWVTGDYQQAADFAFQMLKVFEDLGDEQGLAKAYTLIGLIHEEWDDFDKSKEYHLKSLEINQKANRKYDMAYNYNSLGALHDGFGKGDEAYQYYLKSLELRKEINDEDGMSQSYLNLGGIAHDNKEYDKEFEYYEMALPIVQKLGNVNRMSLISQALGKLHIVKGHYNEANALFQNALGMAQRLGNKRIQRAIYSSLSDLEQQRGNYKKALSYATNERALQDSVFTEEKAKQIAEMEAAYDSEKKEREIEILARDNQIRTLWQNILAGGLATLIFVSVVYYRVQRSNQKRNKELLETQASLNRKLTEVDKMKSHFFASVSHEFRTPLSLIKGPIEQFLQHPEKPLTTDKAQVIHRNSNRLLQLVNQLLDLSKMDSGNLRMENRDGDLYKFLAVVCSSFDSYAQQRGVVYTKHFDHTALPASFDHDKFEKIVYNLLSNAFKFTQRSGSVTFTCKHKDHELEMEVSDTGQGIALAHLPHIFDRFYQVTDQDSAFEGTGIGLSLVKELVSLMEGNIDVTSQPGNGTKFTVSLPIVVISADINNSENEIAEPNVSHETILIIEDNTDMRNFIRQQLEDEYRIVEAADGADGLNVARREIPDLIISDIMMPGMDGIALCEAVKRDERTSHIPLIMLTAVGGYESKIEGLQTGADDYLTKPFYSQELLVRVKNLITQRQQLRKKFGQQVVLQPKNITISNVDQLFLERVENAIEKYLSDPEFGVPQLQEALSMSKTQFHRKMKALTDQAPGEFLRNYRLKRAAQLLEQNGGSVTEIAFSVGFGSLSYFTRSFKDLFGASPSEYSQMQKESKAVSNT